jgi:hypothetical protein
LTSIHVNSTLEPNGLSRNDGKRPDGMTLVPWIKGQPLVCDVTSYPTSTQRHGNFAGVHTLLRILLSSNSAVLINIITGVSSPHFDFVEFYYVLCQC